MTCEHVKLPGGGVAIICSRGQRRRKCSVKGCQRAATLLCDFPVPTGTCDRGLCHIHATRSKRHSDVDYCPEHVAAVLVIDG